MFEAIRFSCSSLQGTEKKGILTPDSDGYYEMPVGGLDCLNSVGDFYPYQTAKNLFESSSAFMRRVSTGCLYGELGHPQHEPNMSMEDYMRRILRIDDKNTCVHLREIWIDFDSVKGNDGRPVIAIMAKLKPAGPHAESMERSLNNPKEDVCLSIRSFTEDRRVGGIKHRNIIEVVTFDKVVEPGIYYARKTFAPSLESLVDEEVTEDNLKLVVAESANIGMESAGLAVAESLLRRFQFDATRFEKPRFMGW